MAFMQSGKFGHLRKNAITVFSAAALTMALMGPATSVFFNTQPAASGVGYALPFALVLALLVTVLVASAIGAFAQKIPTAGFAYTFNSHGFGKRGGFMSGWILIFAYAMVGPMLLSAIGALASPLVQSLTNLAIPWWIFTILFALIAWGIDALGISLSARATLVFLAFEMTIMVALFATILLKGGAQGISLAPFNPANSLGGLSGLGIGLLWSIMFFIGFESAGTLGEETRDARHSIPIALFIAVGIVGCFFVLSGWAATIGFGSSHVNAFVSDSSPWITLAQRFWSPDFVWLISLAGLSSTFANLISGVNATVRVTFVMGREEVLPRVLGSTTANGNPFAALTAYTILSLILALIGGQLWTPWGAYDFFGTVLGLGVVIIYILINLALIVFYRRDYPAEFSPVRHGILPVIASVIMLLPIWGLVWPIPAYPDNVVPYIWFVWIILGTLYLLIIARRRPALLHAIGRAMEEEGTPETDEQQRNRPPIIRESRFFHNLGSKTATRK